MDGIKFNPDADTHRVILRVNPHQDSQAFQRIVCGHLAEWVAKFRAKNRDYSGAGAEPHQVLGVQGQFADIWRKIWKLKKALWDGQELAQEQPEEILHDLIGHCFLTLDLLRESKVERLEADLDTHRDLTQRAEDATALLATAGISTMGWDGPTCGEECRHEAAPAPAVPLLDRIPAGATVVQEYGTTFLEWPTGSKFEVRLKPGEYKPDPATGDAVHVDPVVREETRASEEEAYTAQRTARFKRQRQEAKEAAAWRKTHCGLSCEDGHTYQRGCLMEGME